MMILEEILVYENACPDAQEWAEGKTIEECVEQCHRGDWLLWLAERIGVDRRKLILAKAHCANTVRHLMKDKRSKKAVDIAIAYGEGKATKDELMLAARHADDAYTDGFFARHNHAAAAAFLTVANATAYLNDAGRFADAVASSTADAIADQELFKAGVHGDKDACLINRLLTADICRKYIGQEIIDKVNRILKQKS